MEYLPAGRGGGNRSAARRSRVHATAHSVLSHHPSVYRPNLIFATRLITQTSSLCWRKRASHSINLFSHLLNQLIVMCLCVRLDFCLLIALCGACVTRLGSIAFNAPHYNIKEEQVLQWRHRPLTSSNNEHQHTIIYHIIFCGSRRFHRTHFLAGPL